MAASDGQPEPAPARRARPQVRQGDINAGMSAEIEKAKAELTRIAAARERGWDAHEEARKIR